MKENSNIFPFQAFCCCFFQEPTAIPSRKKKEMGVLEVGVSEESLLQDGLPVKFQDVTFKDPKIKD